MNNYPYIFDYVVLVVIEVVHIETPYRLPHDFCMNTQQNLIGKFLFLDPDWFKIIYSQTNSIKKSASNNFSSVNLHISNFII